MNQFALTPIKGSNAANFAPNTVSGEVYVSSTETYLVAGAAVYLSTAAGNTTIIDYCIANTITPFGFVFASQRKDKFYPGDALEIAIDGSILFLEAGGSIARGAQVQFYPAGNSVITYVTGKTCGIALDTGTTGNLLRILVKTKMSYASSTDCNG
jgi:hypothetical protein